MLVRANGYSKDLSNPFMVVMTYQKSYSIQHTMIHVLSVEVVFSSPWIITFSRYSTQSKGYRVYNKRTRLIVESIHLRFDEIKEMSEMSIANDTSGLVPQRQNASNYDNPDPAPELSNVFRFSRYNSHYNRS
ncbi:hypothetical protein Tco_0060649 [Tanacetum coccineum]